MTGVICVVNSQEGRRKIGISRNSFDILKRVDDTHCGRGMYP